MELGLVPEVQAPQTVSLPRAYGKYELLERIGKGGMAEVFRARLSGAAGFERIVVIKRILPHLAENDGFLRMFVNEAKLAASIIHQNVVQVHELGQLEHGEFFMVMEYVPGSDLKALITSASAQGFLIPIWLSLDVITQALDGLAYAHQLVGRNGTPAEIVHRDVTPRNIFLSEQGAAKIADFGIAKARTLVAETDAGQVKGSIHYMSPEAILGDSVDHRADVFSCGVCLYECLTGRIPFEGPTNYATARMICESERVPPSRYNSKVSARLDAIVMSSLEIEPSDRPQSAAELQTSLLEELGDLKPSRLPHEVQSIVRVMLGELEPTDTLLEALGASGPRVPIQGPLPPEAQTGPIIPQHHWLEVQDEASQPAHHVVGTPLPKKDAQPRFTLPEAASSAPVQPYPGLANDGRLFVKDRGADTRCISDYRALTQLLEQGHTTHVSVDGYTYKKLTTFAKLVGLESFANASSPLVRAALVGDLEGHSLISIFAMIAKGRSTGRLVVMDTSAHRISRREIDVVRGAPVFVSTDDPEHHLPELLIKHGVIRPERATEIMHEALRRGCPMEQALNEREGDALRALWNRIMFERLLGLLRWRYGRFAFDVGVEFPRRGPIVPSLIHWVLPAVAKGYSKDELLHWAEEYGQARWMKGPDFDKLSAAMSLNAQHRRVLDRFDGNTTLEQLMVCYGSDAHLTVRLAFAFSQCGDLVLNLERGN